MLSWYRRTYETPKELYEGLEMEVTPAIEKLIHKVTPYIDRLGRKQGLTAEDIEDLIYKSVMKHLECLRAGTYKFDGGCPTRFTFGIAEQRVKDHWNRQVTVELVYAHGESIPSPLKQIETKDWLEQGFQQLSEKEEQLLRQTYEHGYRDKELIQDPDATCANEPAFRTARKRAKKKFKTVMKSLGGLLWVLLYLTNY